jgi:mRNA interferase MazF
MCAVINKWEKPFHIERGDVYMGELNTDTETPEKGIQRGYRPLIVTQSNWQNKKSTSVIVVPGTSEIKKANLPTHVVLPMIKGLPLQTMALAEQKFTISVERLTKYCCTLPPDIMEQITRACKVVERGDIIKCRKSRKKQTY